MHSHPQDIFLPKSWDLWMGWEMNTGAILLNPLGFLNHINLVVVAQMPGYYEKLLLFRFPVLLTSSCGSAEPQSGPTIQRQQVGLLWGEISQKTEKKASNLSMVT